MRKWNAIISALILAAFLIHGISGGLILTGQMAGGAAWLTAVTHIMLTLIAVHAVIGIALTVKAYRKRVPGAEYRKENRIYRARRYSGFAMILLIGWHVLIFMGKSGEAYRLNLFAMPQLTGSILLVLSLLVHLLTNIRPLLISFGIAGFRIYVKDILWILSIVLLFCAAAFEIYYLRWNVLWRFR